MNKIKRLIRHDLPLHFVLLFTNWLPDNVFFIRLRGRLASPFFKSCGKRLGIGRNVTFYNPSQICIGNDVYIAQGCWFSASELITIEDEVLFGPYNIIASSNHTRFKESFRFGPPRKKTVRFKKGCWMAGHCTTTAGSTIGEGTLVSANSVVIGILEDHSHYAGQPAVLKKIFDE
jgi:acetyltransferase-like isoleucine patch superfamily enzyme